MATVKDLVVGFLSQATSTRVNWLKGHLDSQVPDLFSRAKLAHLLSNPLLSPDWIRLSIADQALSLAGHYHWKIVQRRELRFLDKSLISKTLHSGGSCVLEGVDILDPEINELCASIETVFPCVLCNCEAFYSQLNGEAYPGHCDSDDVFVVQISGSKKWEIFSAQQRRYLDNSPLDESQLGAADAEIVMNPGDILFVKAGVPHRCNTLEDHSLHLSFDLCDRSLNSEQISQQANLKFIRKLPESGSPPSALAQHYVSILQDPLFLAELETLQQKIKAQAVEFRGRIGESHQLSLATKTEY